MIKSTLIELLSKLSADELKKFELFLKSPYHNNLNSPLKLFLELKKFAPEYNSDKLDKEIVWKKIFPGKKFNYGVTKNLIHDLTKLGMKFLAIEHFEKRKLDQDDFLLSQLVFRNCRKLYIKKNKQIERQYSGNPLKNFQLNSEDLFKFRSRSFQRYEYFQSMSELKLTRQLDLQKGFSYIIFADIIFLVKELNNIIISSHDKKYDSKDNLIIPLMKSFNESFFKKILEISKNIQGRDYRIIDTYIALAKALLDPGNTKAYYSYKQKLMQNVSLFSRNELKDLFNCLSTVLTYSSENVLTEALDHFDSMAKLKIITEVNGIIGQNIFYYYIISAFKTHNFEKIESFSKRFADKISDKEKENAKIFSQSLIEFSNGRYGDALKLISKTDHIAIYLKFFIREFRACCLYELNDFQMFENEYKSLYHFLKNYKAKYPRLSDNITSHMKKVKNLFMLREKFRINLYQKLNSAHNDNSPWIKLKLEKIYLSQK